MVNDTGSSREPQISRGVVLPRVDAVPGAEQLSPDATDVPAAEQPTATEAPPPDVEEQGPRHRRPGRPPRRTALVAGVCAVVLGAVVSVFAWTQSRSGPHKADGQRSAALRQAPPVPSRTAAVRSPKASASARVTPSPTHSASPRATPTTRHAASSAPAHHWQSLVVHATYVLHPGESLRSNRISLSLLADGDLVLRDENGRVTWSSGTRGQGTLLAVFQADGNLVVYQGDQTLWSSRTEGHDGATLVLQADGAMRILYGNTALWSTGTG
jgi:hypothetical protein